MAHIGVAINPICNQMGSRLHTHYLYNQSKLLDGCLREFRNINICSNNLCDSIPDDLLGRNNSRNSFRTCTKLSMTYYNVDHEGIVEVRVFEPHRPYIPLKRNREVNSLLAMSLCTLWESHPCKEFITEDVKNRGSGYIAKYSYVIHGIYNKQPLFQQIVINITWELRFKLHELTRHLPIETIQNLCMQKHPDSGCVYVLHKDINQMYTGLSLKHFFLRHMISIFRQNLAVRVPGFWEQRYSYESLLSYLREMGASTERVHEWNEEMKEDIELRKFRNIPLSWNRCSLPFSNSRVRIPII